MLMIVEHVQHLYDVGLVIVCWLFPVISLSKETGADDLNGYSVSAGQIVVRGATVRLLIVAHDFPAGLHMNIYAVWVTYYSDTT